MNFKPIETDENVLVMPGAVVCGDVTVGEGTAFWFNSVCRAELQPIKIGKRCIIAAGAVVTGKMDAPAGSLLVGSPAVVAKPLNDKQKASCLENSELYYRKSVEYRAFLAQQGK